MSSPVMHALGAALYFDRELFVDPAPFVASVEAVFGAASRDGTYVQWTQRVDNRLMPPPKPYDLARLMRAIATRDMRSAAVESKPGAGDAEHALVYAAIGPAATLPEPLGAQAWRYDFEASFGAARVVELGAARIVDIVVAFADAVAASAGVIHWTDTARFASCLASCTQSSRLSDAQSRRISDLLVVRSKWGRAIRGPAWGTFLSAAHVVRLGGLARLEAELAGAASVRGLASGGAYVQATSVAEPIVEEHDDGGRVAQLERVLSPMMA